MKPHSPTTLAKQIAQVTTATLLVAGCPVAVVWWLRVSGTLDAPIPGLLLGMGLSLLVSYLGCVLWEKRPGSEDLLFSELMVWGYLHRLRSQRRLASAMEMVGPVSERQRAALDEMGIKERAGLLEQLVSAMETRDPYLHGHSRRVARHSWMIAKRMGLPREEVARVRMAAAIHDVGKTKTPTAILHKAGTLTDEEYEVIKRHPGDGAVMVSVLHDEELAAIVRHHHERLDGGGYPAGLAGEEIPLGARIIAVADTFDAITSERAYRPASPHRKAMDILAEESGIRLDADVVKAFHGHYAGRGPLALWSMLASLPERVLSWLGTSAASVVSAAKVVAVAALVGGTAATSSSLGVAAHNHSAGTRSKAALAAVAAGATGAELGSGGVASDRPPSAAGPGKRGRGGKSPADRRHSGSTGASQGAGADGGAAEGEAGGEEEGSGEGSETPGGSGEEEPSVTKPKEGPVKSKEPPRSSKEEAGKAPGQGKKTEEAPAPREHPAKPEEPAAKKPEPPAKKPEAPPTPEEKPVKSAPEESPNKGKGSPGSGSEKLPGGGGKGPN